MKYLIGPLFLPPNPFSSGPFDARSPLGHVPCPAGVGPLVLEPARPFFPRWLLRFQEPDWTPGLRRSAPSSLALSGDPFGPVGTPGSQGLPAQPGLIPSKASLSPDTSCLLPSWPCGSGLTGSGDTRVPFSVVHFASSADGHVCVVPGKGTRRAVRILVHFYLHFLEFRASARGLYRKREVLLWLGSYFIQHSWSALRELVVSTPCRASGAPGGGAVH